MLPAPQNNMEKVKQQEFYKHLIKEAFSIIDLDKKGIIDIELGTSGSGYDKFWIPAGGLRLPKSESTSVVKEDDRGNKRTQNDIEMDGFGVWSFINTVVPKQINKILL